MKKNERELILKEIPDLLTKLLNEKGKVDYNHLTFYMGKVEDNVDPDKLGRCRIRVYGEFSDDIPTKDLPWALPDLNFSGSSIGSFVVPPIIPFFCPD